MADETIEINDGLFPIEDGIAYTVKDGLHPQYDLRKLMSNTMRARPQWDDFARVASKILYQEVERHRKALSAARTPEALERAFKITALKMLGLDYRSDLLRDIDYDRALNTIALYNKTKGTEEFVRYMGFIKDAKFELARLWTTDYKDFVDGPAIGWQKVYDDPPGPWYPTTHVGLLYEEFTNKTPIDEADIRALFYRIAPINLVLEWIGAMLTAEVGTLWLATNAWEESEDSANIIRDQRLRLYLSPGEFDSSEETLQTWPKGPFGRAYGNAKANSFEASFDEQRCFRGNVDWSAKTGEEDVTWSATNYVERVIARNKLGVFVGRTSPVYDEYNASRELIGTQIVPERWNFVAGSDDPTGASYTKTDVTVNTAQKFEFLDDSEAYLVSATNRGYFLIPNLSGGRRAVTFIFRPNATSHVALERGSERVILNVGSLVITKSDSSIWAEAQFLGDGWIRLSTALLGTSLRVYPAWGPTAGEHLTASGSIFWRRLQVEDALYPSRPSATANGLPRLRPPTRWTLPASQLAHEAGFFYYEFMLPYPEWTSSPLTLFEFTGSRSRLYGRVDGSGRPYVGVLNESYRHELPDNQSDAPIPLVAGQFNRLVVTWNRPAREFGVYLNGWSTVRQDVEWPANFTGGGIGRTFGSTVTYTSYVRRITLCGFLNAALLPSQADFDYLTS